MKSYLAEASPTLSDAGKQVRSGQVKKAAGRWKRREGKGRGILNLYTVV